VKSETTADPSVRCEHSNMANSVMGGVAVIGTARDRMFRAFDSRTGKELDDQRGGGASSA
jgi:hypothetical protein